MASDTGAVPTAAYHRPPMPAPRRRPAIKEAPVEQRPGEALIWTDGACSGNPGPGGWAAIVIPADGGEPEEHSGGERQTTNNRMELTAALEAEVNRLGTVRWHWVRGHETGVGNEHKALNDRADQLAVAASKRYAA